MPDSLKSCINNDVKITNICEIMPGIGQIKINNPCQALVYD